MKEIVFTDAGRLAGILDDIRSVDRKVVLANGCFDIIHVGHVRYLEEAADQGHILVVAINDDDSTRRLKGEGRPVMPAVERAEILSAMRFVDYVLIFAEDTVDGVLRELRPDVHAKGTDYTVETVPEIETAREIGCVTVITGDPKDRSSRGIISRLRREE
ncbi:MAG: adenylyltransferase/cytidyltransferase family protein [Candidatus Krumholzibacteria bacterium]|nr:adenylyltransferase/cytidyltransferase family protein [Candidatus Krumholzibacteria bacterium]